MRKPWKRRMAQGDGLPGDMIGDMAEDMSKRRRLAHPLRPPEAPLGPLMAAEIQPLEGILWCTPRLRWTGGRRGDQCMARPGGRD